MPQIASDSSTLLAGPGQTERHRGPILLLLGVTVLLMYPWIVWGVPPGHDQDTHLQYFHAFNQQFRSGELYPRWLSSVNYGAGSPIFYIQYPLPFWAGAVVHRALHLPNSLSGESHAFAAVFILDAFGFSVALYFWFSQFVTPRGALLAAIAGLTLPYVLWFDFYTRIAAGECMALSSLPLALYFAGILRTNKVRAIVGTATSFAILILSNLLILMAFSPFYLGYLLAVTPAGKRLRALVSAGWGALLAAGLSAIYLLPLLENRRFFHSGGFSQQASGMYSYGNHLFPINSVVLGTFPSGWWFLNWVLRAAALLTVGLFWYRRGDLKKMAPSRRVLVLVALAVIVVTVLAPFLAPPILEVQAANPVASLRSHIFGFAFLSMLMSLCLALVYYRDRTALGTFSFACCLGSFLMMTDWAGSVWHHLHVLWNLQFPWRFFACLSLFLAAQIALSAESIGLAERATRARFALGALVIPISLLSLFAWRVPAKMAHREPDRQVRSVDVALPTYIQATTNFDELNRWPSSGTAIGDRIVEGIGKIQVAQFDPRGRVLDVICSTDCLVQTNLIYFPKWRVEEGRGHSLSIGPTAENGLADIRLSAGSHRLVFSLPIEWPEKAGAAVTALSVMILLALIGLAFVRGNAAT